MGAKRADRCDDEEGWNIKGWRIRDADAEERPPLGPAYRTERRDLNTRHQSTGQSVFAQKGQDMYSEYTIKRAEGGFYNIYKVLPRQLSYNKARVHGLLFKVPSGI